MKAVVVNPGEEAEIREVENSLSTLQQIVEGYIEVYYPFEDQVCIICNEEGKINGMEPNRAVYDGDELADIIFGPFLVAGLSEDDFTSLTDEMAEKYLSLFEHPQLFSMQCGKITVEQM